jgi:hypothetical protein
MLIIFIREYAARWLKTKRGQPTCSGRGMLLFGIFVGISIGKVGSKAKKKKWLI